MNKKRMILIGGGVLLLLLIGGGAWYGYSKYKALKASIPVKEKTEAEKKAEEEARLKAEEAAEMIDAHGKPIPMTIVPYKNTVNLDRKNAYLVAEFNIHVKDPELGKALMGDKPTLESSEFKAIMLSLLSGRTLEEAMELDLREALCQEIKEKLNEKFAPKPPEPLKPGEKPKKEDKEKENHKKPKKPIKEVLVVDWKISS